MGGVGWRQIGHSIDRDFLGRGFLGRGRERAVLEDLGLGLVLVGRLRLSVEGVVVVELEVEVGFAIVDCGNGSGRR